MLEESGLIPHNNNNNSSDLNVPSDWNTSKDGLYILKYRMINPSHDEVVPDDVILKALQIGSTLSLNLIHEKTGTSKSIEIEIGDYISGDHVLRVDGVSMLRDLCREKLLNEKITVAVSKNSRHRLHLRLLETTTTTIATTPPPTTRTVRHNHHHLNVINHLEIDLYDHLVVSVVISIVIDFLGGGFGGGGFGRGGGGSLMGPDHPMFGGRGGTGLFQDVFQVQDSIRTDRVYHIEAFQDRDEIFDRPDLHPMAPRLVTTM